MTESLDPRTTFGEALLAAADENPNIVALSADSSAGSGLSSFRIKYPDRHIELGIMEQGMMGIAAGLATTGKIPIVTSGTPFVTVRPFEMLRNDVGYMAQNVKVVGRCAGLTYATLGPTHVCLEDVALTRLIPGMTVMSPGDPIEITRAVQAMIAYTGPVYMRLGMQRMPVLCPEDAPFEIGKATLLRDGRDVAVLGTGTALSKAYEAVQLLAAEGVDVRLLSVHTIKPLDRDAIIEAARETGRVVTVEEHYCGGGLGSAVADLLAVECPTPMRMIGVHDQFVTNGPYEELLGVYGLQSKQIYETVKEFVQAG